MIGEPHALSCATSYQTLAEYFGKNRFSISKERCHMFFAYDQLRVM